MSALSYAIFLPGGVLEFCLLGLLLRKGLWRQYPYFSFYILWILIRTLVMYGILIFIPSLYSSLYWRSDTVDVVLRFLIAWEVFRHTFPEGSALNGIVSKGFAVVALGLGTFAIATFWSYVAYTKFHSVYPALERSFGFAQAALILWILLAVRYYDLRLGRNLWGIAVAFGGWVSVSTVNNAMIDLDHSLLPYWGILRPLSFLVELSIWVWALRVYAPNPAIAAGETAEQDSALGQWEKGWSRTTSTARRALHP
jgi:hypothetical protein